MVFAWEEGECMDGCTEGSWRGSMFCRSFFRCVVQRFFQCVCRGVFEIVFEVCFRWLD